MALASANNGQPALDRSAKSPGRWRRYLSAYLFLVPAFVFYATFRLAPYLQSFWYAFFDWDGASPAKWIGFGNYAEVIQDKYFWNAASHNVVLMAMNLTIPLSIAFMLALLVAEVRHGRTLFRVSLFTPHVLSAAVVAIMWMQIYQPSLGIINVLLKQVGLEGLTRAWLGEGATALPAANLASAWMSYGFAFVIYMAAMQGVDPMLYEAARLDGANWLQLVRHVTLPGVRNSTTMLLSLSIMGSMVSFTMVFIMTGGGPNFASEVLSTYIYDMAFGQLRFGYASAVSVGLALWILLVTVSFIRFRERGD